MRELNWDYVAGFFDGEGNISVGPNAARPSTGQYRASFSQSGAIGGYILYKIKEFLAVNGIHSLLRMQSKETERHQTSYALLISGKTPLLSFLSAIFPYLCVKRTQAQDAIRFLRLYPDRQALVLANMNRERKKQGWYEEIAARKARNQLGQFI
jgi:hypothetical protein